MNEILSSENILFWSSFSYTSECSRVDILAEDASKLFEVLANRKDFAHWHFELLDKGRKRSGSVKSIRFLQYSQKMNGIRLYERVAAEGDLSFRTRVNQGIEINLWKPIDGSDAERTFISPGVFEENGSVLSDPISAPEHFYSELALREKSVINRIVFPIDAVYTWVDGSDEQWKIRKSAAIGNEGTNGWVHEANVDSRFQDHEELRYSLRSIYQYAPWIRNIYIVTDQQVPEWLNEFHEKIKIIDHKDIWPDEIGLPSFNSHAIEACLHRIPGLSENYLYINDDVLFTRPVGPSLFFEPSGLSKVFFSRAQVNFSNINSWDNASSIAAKNSQRIMLEEAGVTFSRKYFHAPGAINRLRMKELEDVHGEVFAKTRSQQFRSSSDIAASGSFYFNNALLKGWAIPGSIRYDYIDPGSEDGRARMDRVIASRNFDCIVVNDGASNSGESSEDINRFIGESLARLLPLAAPWEKFER